MTKVEELKAYRDSLKKSVNSLETFDPVEEAMKAEDEEREIINLQMEIADLQQKEQDLLSR